MMTPDKISDPNKAMEPRVLEGTRFRLTPFHEHNITDAYLQMLNDPKINQFLQVRWTTQTRETTGAFVRSFYAGTEKYIWSIHARENDLFIGTATLSQINRRHGSAEIGLMVGTDAYWGKGASEETFALVAGFTFETLKLRRLTGGSLAPNHGINFTFKRLGFRCEGRNIQAFMLEPGVYVDGFRWAILEDEWRARKRGNK